MRAFLAPGFVPTTFVAVDDDLLGSAAIVACDMETHGELSPWLASVYVRDKYRRRGVGSALVRHVMQAAACNGFDTLYLFTPDRESFYRQLGWSHYERTPYHGETVVVMRADLRTL